MYTLEPYTLYPSLSPNPHNAYPNPYCCTCGCRPAQPRERAGPAMSACVCGSRGRSVCHPLDVPPHTGDDRISEEEFALYFSKVMKVKTAHAKALFRVADSRTRDGFLEFREFLGLMAILYRHTYTIPVHMPLSSMS